MSQRTEHRRIARPSTLRSTGLAAVCLTAATLLANCLEPPEAECRRSEGCADGMYCHLGACRPMTLPESDASERDTTAAEREDVVPTRVTDTTAQPDSDGSSTEEGCARGRNPAPGDLVLNEILPNVPTGAQGDTNGDGTRDASDDEFVELVNRTSTPLRLTGVRIIESGDDVTAFQNLCLESRSAVVVFGGIDGDEPPEIPGDAETRISRKRLGLSNSGGKLRVVGRDGETLGTFEWGSAPRVSFTLSPQIDGSSHLRHDELAEDLSSPGRCARGGRFANGCRTAGADTGVSNGDVAP